MGIMEDYKRRVRKMPIQTNAYHPICRFEIPEEYEEDTLDSLEAEDVVDSDTST
jgi:hypothetical protein